LRWSRVAPGILDQFFSSSNRKNRRGIVGGGAGCGGRLVWVNIPATAPPPIFI